MCRHDRYGTVTSPAETAERARHLACTRGLTLQQLTRKTAAQASKGLQDSLGSIAIRIVQCFLSAVSPASSWRAAHFPQAQLGLAGWSLGDGHSNHTAQRWMWLQVGMTRLLHPRGSAAVLGRALTVSCAPSARGGS